MEACHRATRKTGTSMPLTGAAGICANGFAACLHWQLIDPTGQACKMFQKIWRVFLKGSF